MRRQIALSAAVLLCSAAACFAQSQGDARRLTAAETAAIIPLLCQNPVSQKDGDYACTAIIGYPDSAPNDATISLDAITYGAFTTANADEAYVSYTASFEPHANNFGGGIALARSGDRWRLESWYPGHQMSDCLALPDTGTQRMLCRGTYEGMGEADSSVWIRQVPFDHDQAILKAQDQRQSDTNLPCETPTRAILLSIGALKRSDDPHVFAVVPITYAAAPDLARACLRKDFKDVAETRGEARFVLQDGKLKALTPVHFAPPDY